MLGIPIPALAGPGAAVTTLDFPSGNRVNYGTSFSAPHVAAIWTRLRAAQPTWTSSQILAAIEQECPVVTDETRNDASASRVCWSSEW
jgi:hypothetical protein